MSEVWRLRPQVVLDAMIRVAHENQRPSDALLDLWEEAELQQEVQE